MLLQGWVRVSGSIQSGGGGQDAIRVPKRSGASGAELNRCNYSSELHGYIEYRETLKKGGRKSNPWKRGPAEYPKGNE